MAVAKTLFTALRLATELLRLAARLVEGKTNEKSPPSGDASHKNDFKFKSDYGTRSAAIGKRLPYATATNKILIELSLIPQARVEFQRRCRRALE